MDIGSMFSALSHHPELIYMSHTTLTRLFLCLSMLKNDILLPQPRIVSVTSAPDVLPPSITEFISTSFVISQDAVGVLWDMSKTLCGYFRPHVVSN